MRRGIVLLVVALALVTRPERPAASVPAATALLDQYARGEFAAVTEAIAHIDDFDALLKDLQATGRPWIAAGPPADVPRRRLVAATVALEAARADEWHEWKLVLHHDRVGSFQPADAVYWKPPPRLIVWGASLFYTAGGPTPLEHLWQLAAIAVAERGEDFEFLIGSPFEARGTGAEEEILYLPPVLKRFPTEPRFQLAQAVALAWRSWPGARRSTLGTRDAADLFEALSKDQVVGGEAMVRLGDLRLRVGRLDDARQFLARAETATRDPYLIYLARFLTGQSYEKDHRTDEAIAAYRRALVAMPRVQSASIALAAQLFLKDQRTEAGALVDANMSSQPQPVDPWRTFVDGDDRFWPELIADLRREIAK
jgi:tetratricopeptide (TPR) repeat protein